MKTVTVQLGGKAYEIKAQPYGKSKEWRKAAARPLGAIATFLERAPGLQFSGKNLDDLKVVSNFLQAISHSVVQAPDMFAELMFQYSPELTEDRERIEAEAYDEEIASVIVEIVKFAYPFGSFRQIFSNGLSGQSTPTTTTSSPGPNGVSTPEKKASTEQP